MNKYYVTLCDELGEEFGVYVNATGLDSCLEYISEQYPESSIINARKA